MWSQDRHQRITALLKSNQRVSANDLADLLGVSRETVRRDLLELEESGQVERVHGGAVLPSRSDEEPFDKRRDAQARAKQQIARKAASLIKPGTSILIDAGTTTAAFGQVIASLSGLMVVTNSIEIAQTIKAAEADIELVLIGGKIVSDVPATYGGMTIADIRRFEVDLAVVSPVAFHPVKGTYSFVMGEAEVAEAMIGQARKTIVLCDRTKLGETSRIQVCRPERVDTLITDNKALPEQTDPFQENGIKVVIA